MHEIVHLFLFLWDINGSKNKLLIPCFIYSMEIPKWIWYDIDIIYFFSRRFYFL